MDPHSTCKGAFLWPDNISPLKVAISPRLVGATGSTQFGSGQNEILGSICLDSQSPRSAKGEQFQRSANRREVHSSTPIRRWEELLAADGGDLKQPVMHDERR